MSILSLGTHTKNIFESERKSLLANYPGLTLHRLKQDLKLHASLNAVDDEDLFELAYLPHPKNPLTNFFEKLHAGIPLEYITGFAFFYRSSFRVSEDVLIPRSETEILVELATQEIQKNYKNKKCRIADIGTGSGAIALSLLLEDSAAIEMVASDISEAALKIAKANYFQQRFSFSPGHKMSFVLGDRLNAHSGEFDIILSNPPYIKKIADFSEVHGQVKTHEPHLALFLDDASYDQWFEEFFQSIYNKLAAHGLSLIEGHENHLESLASLANKIGFKEVVIIKDYTQRNRFLKIKK